MSDLEECQAILERVYAFHDGELEWEEIDQISSHLVGCESCLGHYETEKAMRALIRRGCLSEAPAGLRERIRESIAVG
ncbi:MAG: mycothiol system anti-sigma-R factor [Propionibacteriaceae bacterium]|jgi:mycothiol system anti-sigma-R factor|nr:mycothiol system anti-sigma-R factor [Propionibacteriaceae bacterium]